MDVLSEILASIRISGSVLAEIRCGGDWGIDMGFGEGIPFHYLIEGEGWLKEGKAETHLCAGDLVAAPHWPCHALASSPDVPCVQITQLISESGLPAWKGGTLDRPLVFRAGTGQTDVRILSGVFTLEGRGANMLLEQLPPILHLRAQAEGLATHLRTALEFIQHESTGARPGYVAVAARLMDLMFIQILRAAIMQPAARIGLLAGLADARIGRALAAVHADPARPWTVASLAAVACHSRTIFAERFRQMIGLTPIQYVNKWRMTMAEDLLLRRDISIDVVRRQLGYSSSFTFARAFRAHHGVSPRAFRKANAYLSGPHEARARARGA